MDKKIISRGKFSLHVVLSFIVWSEIMRFLIIGIVGGWIYSITRNNPVLYLICFNLLWIFESFVVLLLTYIFNRKHRVSDDNLISMRRSLVVIFYILIIIVNNSIFRAGMFINSIVTIIMFVLHMVVIWISNKFLFSKYIANNQGNMK